MFTITGPDGAKLQYNQPVLLTELAEKYQHMYASPIAEAVVDGVGRSLMQYIDRDARLKFIETNNEEGMRVYQNTLVLIFVAGLKAVLPEVRVEVHNAIGDGLYCAADGYSFSEADLRAVAEKMKEIIAARLPIECEWLPRGKALEGIYESVLQDDASLLALVPEDKEIPTFKFKNYRFFVAGYMYPHTGCISLFKLEKYKEGVLLRIPKPDSMDIISDFVDRRKLSDISEEAEEWGQIIGCPTVAKLNEIIAKGQDRDIILMAEALHEKKLAQIADMVKARRGNVHMVLIAGPSSSGKTTFAQRLSVQLRVNGFKPIPISLDNYFKCRAETPRHPDGSYDFECLEALDVDLFQQQVLQLFKGGTVEVPHFNFHNGEREYKGDFLHMEENSILVVEGIHGLNDALTSHVPAENKMKIYISALTPLSFDNFNRIHTTDMRLLRRMVRDFQYRSRNAEGTLKMWSSVREGEEKYIFPFAENADVMFNTTLIYEIAALKPYAEGLLQSVDPNSDEYAAACRLLALLACVRPINEKAIPNNSVMKEFLGGSIFEDVL